MNSVILRKAGTPKPVINVFVPVKELEQDYSFKASWDRATVALYSAKTIRLDALKEHIKINMINPGLDMKEVIKASPCYCQ